MAFIGEHRERFGVERICRVLTERGCAISPSGFYAHLQWAACARSVRDREVLAEIARVHGDPPLGGGLYGARTVWHQLRREGGVAGLPVPRCQVELLMHAAGLQGARRGKVSRTTGPTRPRPGRRTW